MYPQKQKKIAVINDFSGFGRCSLTVSIPIISAFGIECCALPTAIFSNHTGYEDYYFDDYTDKMEPYFSKWKKLGLEFDGIYTGFLGSDKQINIVTKFIREFAKPETAVVIDPVMGDNGRTYATLTEDLCRHIGQLAGYADILTPNLTEACILTDYPYRENISDTEELKTIAAKLQFLGSKNIVITGINNGNNISNFILRQDGTYILQSLPRTGGQRAGTGDVFASIISADSVNGTALEDSVKRAAEFVGRAIALSDRLNIPSQEGVCFEMLLATLNES
ncbi:MAG: pyridoxamine kinase [Clostridia bacterium]|nr:pyridoxamine kinase [Clostridia bacterium]